MMRLALAHPGYGFERHMGYSVPEHFAALARLGPTIHHRRSFSPVAARYLDTAPTRRNRPGRIAALAFASLATSPNVIPRSGLRRRASRGADALRLHLCRAFALASGAGGVDRGAGAGRAVDAGADAVLFRAARRPAVRARDRQRIAARHLSRAAAGVLACRSRLSSPPATACSASICSRRSAWW